MKIKSFQGGFDKNLSYLIWCESTHIAGIVDASVNMTEINEFIKIHDLILERFGCKKIDFNFVFGAYPTRETLFFLARFVCKKTDFNFVFGA